MRCNGGADGDDPLRPATQDAKVRNRHHAPNQVCVPWRDVGYRRDRVQIDPRFPVIDDGWTNGGDPADPQSQCDQGKQGYKPAIL